jgi:hypothetical protein
MSDFVRYTVSCHCGLRIDYQRDIISALMTIALHRAGWYPEHAPVLWDNKLGKAILTDLQAIEEACQSLDV